MEPPSATSTDDAPAAAAAAVKTMNVLVAIDDSDESFDALRWVIDKFLKQVPGVLTIVHVVEPLPQYAHRGGYVIESMSHVQEQNAARILSRALDICKDNSLKAKTIIMEGDPKDKICRATEETKVDLLVVGSRGLGQIKRAFLGSVSDYCAHHASCAVMVVKPSPPPN